MGKITQQNSIPSVDQNIINLFVYKGDNINITIDVTEDSVAFDFTGYTALMKLKRRRGDQDEFTVITFDTSDSSIVLASGKITLIKGNTALDNIRSGKYVYDIQITETGTGVVQSIISGSFIVEEEITT